MKCFFETCHEAVTAATQTKGFGIFFSEESNPTQHVHVHDCCEIFLSLEGGSTFLVDDRVYDIQNGDLFVINQFEAHKVVASKSGKFARYILHVHPAFIYANSQGNVSLAPCFYSANKITKLSPTKAEIARLVALFEDMRCEHEYGDEIYKRLRATEILLEVNRLFSTRGTARTDAAVPRVENRRLTSRAAPRAPMPFATRRFSLPLIISTPTTQARFHLTR